MRTGFPAHLDILNLLNLFKSKQYFSVKIENQKLICGEVMRSCGLEWKDFKLGNTKIFLRNKKLELVSEKLNGDLALIINQHKKLKMLRTKWRIALIVTRFCAIRKNRSIRNNDASITNSSTNAHSQASSQGRRKRKSELRAHQTSSQSESTQVSGIP